MEWSLKSTGGIVPSKAWKGRALVWDSGSGADRRLTVQAWRTVVQEERYQCGFCKGSGMISKEAKCPVCKGRAIVTIMNSPAVACAFCHGTGRAKRGSTLTCIACKGKGMVASKETVTTCQKCNGSGKEPHNPTLPCSGCKGSGVVSSGKAERRLRTPSGTERDAAKAIYDLGGKAGRHAVSREIGVSIAYSEYVLKSMVVRGYIEKAGGAVYTLTPECEKIITALVKKEEEKARMREEREKEKEKAKAMSGTMVGAESSPWQFL